MTWRPLPGGEDHRPELLGRSLDRLARSLGAPPARVLSCVFANWTEIVGERVANHSHPVSIRDGTLVIAASDPAWASELRWLAPELLERLAQVTGEPVASRIQVRLK